MADWIFQIAGQKDPGIYYAATIVSPAYEVPPLDPGRFRWRTAISPWVNLSRRYFLDIGLREYPAQPSGDRTEEQLR
jgi:hypothetical protein